MSERVMFGYNPLETLDWWYEEYKKLALRCGIPEIVSDKECYQDAFEDGESPDDFLTTEVSYAID